MAGEISAKDKIQQLKKQLEQLQNFQNFFDASGNTSMRQFDKLSEGILKQINALQAAQDAIGAQPTEPRTMSKQEEDFSRLMDMIATKEKNKKSLPKNNSDSNQWAEFYHAMYPKDGDKELQKEYLQELCTAEQCVKYGFAHQKLKDFRMKQKLKNLAKANNKSLEQLVEFYTHYDEANATQQQKTLFNSLKELEKNSVKEIGGGSILSNYVDVSQVVIDEATKNNMNIICGSNSESREILGMYAEMLKMVLTVMKLVKLEHSTTYRKILHKVAKLRDTEIQQQMNNRELSEKKQSTGRGFFGNLIGRRSQLSKTNDAQDVQTNAAPDVQTNAAPTNAAPTNDAPDVQTNAAPTNAAPTNDAPDVQTNAVQTNASQANASQTNAAQDVQTNAVQTNASQANASQTNAAQDVQTAQDPYNTQQTPSSAQASASTAPVQNISADTIDIAQPLDNTTVNRPQTPPPAPPLPTQLPSGAVPNQVSNQQTPSSAQASASTAPVQKTSANIAQPLDNTAVSKPQTPPPAPSLPTNFPSGAVPNQDSQVITADLLSEQFKKLKKIPEKQEKKEDETINDVTNILLPKVTSSVQTINPSGKSANTTPQPYKPPSFSTSVKPSAQQSDQKTDITQKPSSQSPSFYTSVKPSVQTTKPSGQSANKTPQPYQSPSFSTSVKPSAPTTVPAQKPSSQSPSSPINTNSQPSAQTTVPAQKTNNASSPTSRNPNQQSTQPSAQQSDQKTDITQKPSSQLPNNASSPTSRNLNGSKSDNMPSAHHSVVSQKKTPEVKTAVLRSAQTTVPEEKPPILHKKPDLKTLHSNQTGQSVAEKNSNQTGQSVAGRNLDQIAQLVAENPIYYPTPYRSKKPQSSANSAKQATTPPVANKPSAPVNSAHQKKTPPVANKPSAPANSAKQATTPPVANKPSTQVTTPSTQVTTPSTQAKSYVKRVAKKIEEESQDKLLKAELERRRKFINPSSPPSVRKRVSDIENPKKNNGKPQRRGSFVDHLDKESNDSQSPRQPGR